MSLYWFNLVTDIQSAEITGYCDIENVLPIRTVCHIFMFQKYFTHNI